ncbi:MAG: competence/damage-inducible protein A [Desulfuromonadaceae bacterium]
MSEPVCVEIFIIGDEILIGDIQDTNTHWLCKEINELGGHVVRATVMRDISEVIAAEMQAALLRGADVIITSGGLGPTADDLTLEAVALGVGVEWRLHEQALQMIRQRYDELAGQGILTQGGLNPAREKMAWLPVGAAPLHNPVGTAPGVLFKAGQTTIISLPGVPSELKGIFKSSLQPFLLATFSGGMSAMRTISVQCNDESLLEPVLSRVAHDYPGIYVKSLATTIGENSEMDIIITAVGRARSELDSLLEPAVTALKTGFTGLGIGHRLKA